MLDLDNKSSDKVDYIKADGKKFYVSPQVPAKLVFGIQALALNMQDADTGDTKGIESTFNNMLSFIKDILYIDKRNEKDDVIELVDNLTFPQVAAVTTFISEQITITAKKKTKTKKNGK